MKKSFQLSLVISAFLFLVFHLAIPASADSIKVGLILPLTGKLARFGEIENKSFLMAVEEINAAGGINGKSIDLIIEDTEGKPDVGRSAMEKLISQDNVIIVGGGYSSSVTWAAATFAQQHKMPFLVNTGSADRITEQDWDYIFRLNPPASEYSKALGSFLSEAIRIKTVALLYENNPFGKSGSKKFAKQCNAMGLKVLMREGYESDAIDFVPLLSKVKAKNPDLVYLISYAMDTAAQLLRQAKELDFNPGLLVGASAGFTLSEFTIHAGDASDYIYSTTLWTPSVPYPGAEDYYSRFLEKYGVPTDYHGAEAYAAMYVIADALERAKTLNPEDIRDSLANTNLMTVFGPVKFTSYDKKTQQNRLPVSLVQWQRGKLEIVWPENLANTKHIFPTPKWNER